MIRKKQVIPMATIAVISFIIGTMFNAVTMATGRGGNPFDEIWEAIYDLEDQLDSIECGNKTGFMSAPAYDSGWLSMKEGEETVFAHNLDTTEVFVYVIGKDTEEIYKIHQYEYGGTYWAYWHKLDSNNISVTSYYPWDHVRVIIWRIPEPVD
jgi:hypothetical protein